MIPPRSESAAPTGDERDLRLLTPREQEILTYLPTGMTNREIAACLQRVRKGEGEISHQTVTKHVHGILRKLHLSSRTEAAVYAVTHGLTLPIQEDHHVG